MALLDMSFTRSFFSEIANANDTCYYCEKAIREKKGISHDEFSKKIKSIKGVLDGKRVAKLKYVGHEFCICSNCLENIAEEIIIKDKHTEAVNEILDAAKDIVDEESMEETSKAKPKTKAKGK